MQQSSMLTEKISSRRQFCTFRIEQRLFGVNITDVKEIQPPVRFTPVFHAPPEIKGFVNIRGHIHLVIDLRILMGFEPAEMNKNRQIVLFKPHVGESFGILVDHIGDVVEAEETRIESFGEQKGGVIEKEMKKASDLGIGVCKLKDCLLIILDSAMLLKKVWQS